MLVSCLLDWNSKRTCNGTGTVKEEMRTLINGKAFGGKIDFD
jgi:hypothetical protein